MENCVIVNKDNIKAVFQAVYSNKGILVKIHEEIYGFVNSTNRVTLLNSETKKMCEYEYVLDYIGEHVICMHEFTNLVDLDSIMIRRSNFDLIYRSDKSIQQVGDIIYEQGRIQLLDSEENRKIFNLEGRQIGIIYAGMQFSIKQSDLDNMYICEYKSINKDYTNKDDLKNTTLFFRYNEGDIKIEILGIIEDYMVKEIGTGLLLFTNYVDSKDVFVYDIINNKKL